jgi:EpsI family protein
MSPAWRHYWITVSLVAMAVPLPAYLSSGSRTPLQRPLNEFSYEIGSWRGHDAYLSERVRAVLGTDDILLREYVDAGALPISLYVSYFGRQQQRETNHSPQNCLPGAGWQPLRARRVPYPRPGADGATINEILYEKDGQRQVVFYWFRERDRIVASEYLVKWYLMWDAMTRRRTDGALVRVSTLVADSEDAARQRALDFMRLTLPRLNEFLPE